MSNEITLPPNFHRPDRTAYPRRIRSFLVFWSSFLILLAGCSTPPDLSDPSILESAKREAFDLDLLERKLMYGMIRLYVDQEENPYSGLVRQTGSNSEIMALGNLEKGQKHGLWLEWHENGKLKSKCGWKNDRYWGEFKVWHDNGKIKALGQTSDGEVDGRWTSFYRSGRRASVSWSSIGHAVSAKVWKPNGQPCPQTNLSEGKGTLVEYLENGSVKRRRDFEDGVSVRSNP